MDPQSSKQPWEALEQLLTQLEAKGYWTARRDACEALAHLASQATYAIRRAAQDPDPDVAHWGHQYTDRLKKMMAEPLAEVARQMDRERSDLRASQGMDLKPAPPAEPSQPALSPLALLTWLEQFAGSQEGSFARRGDGATLTLTIEGGRHQTLYLEFGASSDPSQPYALFYSICGLAKPETFAWALEANATLTRGSFAVIRHKDQSVLIMMLRRRLNELTPATLERKLLYLAAKADWAESQLGEADRH